ncbi:MAG: hypothetical protein M3P04_01805 [Actinomycetota bacterium]|nr:hypothetical protein [Actinomycetota bacterium]
MRIPPVTTDQRGLFTRAQAADHGWSKGALDRALASRRLESLAPGILVAAERLATLSRRDRHLLEARALVLAHGDRWHLARRTAGVAHGLPLLGRAPSEVQLSRPKQGASQSHSRHRRVLGLAHPDRCVVDGLPCTSVARTVFDLARAESFRSGVVVADAALRSGLSRDELLDVVARHRGWPGSRRVREVVMFADGRAESPLESLGRVSCLEEGLPVFDPQVRVLVDGIEVARVDGLWREQLVVFEGDGAVKFDGEGVLPALLARQEGLHDARLAVVRAGWADLTQRRPAFAARVRRRFEEREGVRLPSWVQLVATGVRVTPLSQTDHYLWPPLPSATPRAEALADEQVRGVA